MNPAEPQRILLVTGLSGAGKTTVLKTLEDVGWETVDNMPLSLLAALLESPRPAGAERGRPIAIGLDSRTRGFDPGRIVRQAERLGKDSQTPIEILFLDCGPAELVRRYSETRARHPLAPDRPAADGIAEEVELMSGLRNIANHLLDTTDSDASSLRREIRLRYAAGRAAPTLGLVSFGFAGGLPRNADLVFDMRFLVNPHWVRELRPLSGHDPQVVAHIQNDPAYAEALERIEALLLLLLPRYREEGKTYVSVAFGCTGGRHRSVHVTERIAARLREAGFSPTLEHRDLGPRDGTDEARAADLP